MVAQAGQAVAVREAGRELQLVAQAYLGKVMLAVQQYLEVLVGQEPEAAARLLLVLAYLAMTQVPFHLTVV
jgi:hypothetical protein